MKGEGREGDRGKEEEITDKKGSEEEERKKGRREKGRKRVREKEKRVRGGRREKEAREGENKGEQVRENDIVMVHEGISYLCTSLRHFPSVSSSGCSSLKIISTEFFYRHIDTNTQSCTCICTGRTRGILCTIYTYSESTNGMHRNRGWFVDSYQVLIYMKYLNWSIQYL